MRSTQPFLVMSASKVRTHVSTAKITVLVLADMVAEQGGIQGKWLERGLDLLPLSQPVAVSCGSPRPCNVTSNCSTIWLEPTAPHSCASFNASHVTMSVSSTQDTRAVLGVTGEVQALKAGTYAFVLHVPVPTENASFSSINATFEIVAVASATESKLHLCQGTSCKRSEVENSDIRFQVVAHDVDGYPITDKSPQTIRVQYSRQASVGALDESVAVTCIHGVNYYYDCQVGRTLPAGNYTASIVTNSTSGTTVSFAVVEPQCLSYGTERVQIGGIAQCRTCDKGSFGRGQCLKCDEQCPDCADCDGGYRLQPRSGYWRGAPYFRTCVSASHVPDILTPYKYPADLLEDRGLANSTGEACDGGSLVSSPAEGLRIDGPSTEWPIFACPGGSDACAHPKGAMGCSAGYYGPACAWCRLGYVWSEGHKCTPCTGQGTLSWQVGVGFIIALAVAILYHNFLSHPIFAQGGVGVGQRLLARVGTTRSGRLLRRPLQLYERLSGRVLALKEKHAARAEHLSTIGRSLIGFAQVIGNLSGVRVEWPADFRSLSSWLRYLQIAIDVPSVACVISQSLEYTFFQRLLVYTLGPLAIIALFALPLLWANARKLDEATRTELRKLFIRASLFVILLLCPIVRAHSFVILMLA